MKKIIPKGDITKYIHYKHKNTGTSCKSIGISGLQFFNSSTKYWKQYHENLRLKFLLKYEVNFPD